MSDVHEYALYKREDGRCPFNDSVRKHRVPRKHVEHILTKVRQVMLQGWAASMQTGLVEHLHGDIYELKARGTNPEYRATVALTTCDGHQRLLLFEVCSRGSASKRIDKMKRKAQDMLEDWRRRNCDE